MFLGRRRAIEAGISPHADGTPAAAGAAMERPTRAYRLIVHGAPGRTPGGC